MTPTDLQTILRQRLPNIDRWQRVSVYNWKSKQLPWYIYQPEEGMFYIVWSNPKRNNAHEYEYKECPLTDLGILIERNQMRLRNKTKEHK